MCGDPTSDLDLVSVGGASPAVFSFAAALSVQLEQVVGGNAVVCRRTAVDMEIAGVGLVDPAVRRRRAADGRGDRAAAAHHSHRVVFCSNGASREILTTKIVREVVLERAFLAIGTGQCASML